MKKSILLIALSLFSLLVFAQKELVIKKSAKGTFVSHTVSPKENFYSIGRLYNVPAKEIASFNNVDMAHGLNIGQVINIPLSTANYTQEEAKGVPVYFTAEAKQSLTKVSAAYQVSVANLRSWNNLADDNVAAGHKLIVGFIHTGELAAAAPAIKPAPRTPKPDPQPVFTETLDTAPVTVKNEEPAPPVEKPAPPKKEPEKTVAQTAAQVSGGSGFFKSQFQLQVKVQPLTFEETVAAGIFKTASGWQDGKYYALMDNVEPGTIIKIENPNNNKAIYAKVLDKVSGIRQNEGYDLRMSNAAAVALEIADNDKFFVRVIY